MSVWVRDIELTEEQEQAMMMRAYRTQRAARDKLVERRRRERLEAQEEGRQLARRGEAMHTAGCMLYWAEGDKCRNSVRLSNADPALVRFFIRFLRAYFDVDDETIRVTCNLFADHADRKEAIERYWLKELGLTERSLNKSIVNVYSIASKRKRINMLPYGTCKICVSRTAIVQSIYGSIQEYAGIERPEWLD